MRFTLCALALIVVVASAYEHKEVFQAFTEFAQTYDKSYANEEEFEYRLSVFVANLEQVERDNRQLVLAGKDAVFGITQFSDLTHEEFRSTFLMTNYTPLVIPEEEYEVPQVSAPAAEIDWRTKGVLTSVKDQGHCGSCWAFSATEAIESFAKLAGKPLDKLAPQQIVSCDSKDGGCRGGRTETAYQYALRAGGLELEKDYPYTARNDHCAFDKSKVAIKIAGYKKVSRGESNLHDALNKGPVSVCLAADSFQHYHSGVLSSCPGRIDHCVQAVGYTSEYWIVRNSWGTGWGEKGFIRIERGKDLCHIAEDVTYPTF